MTTPTPVEIVRPKATLPDLLTGLVGSALVLLVRAWIVMLLAPLVGLTPGYWLTVGVVYGVRTLVSGHSSFRSWTRSAR